jgi:hypothetical protein
MRRTAFAEGWLLFVIFLLLSTGISRAQDLDNLDDLESLDEDVVTEKPFEAGIDTDKWELSFQIGFMDLAQTLFQADQIVVKWNSKGKIFGDMEVTGKSSFSPQVRISRNWGHLGWQGTVGLCLADFSQSVSNTKERSISGNQGDVILLETDLETGSLALWYHDFSLVYNVKTKGRILPYVLGGVGAQYWFVDSAYINDTRPALTYSIGGGIRIVGDDLFSVTLEVRNYFSKVEHRSDSIFRANVVDPQDDTRQIDIPVTNLDAQGLEVPFAGFQKESLSTLWYAIGIVATF